MKLILALAFCSVALALPKFEGGQFMHTRYQSFSEIVDILKGFQNSNVGAGVTWGTLSPQTAEGKDIPMLQVTGGTGFNKKKIFVEAGIHGREWMGPASALYFIDKLISGRNINPEAQYLYNNFDWYFVPLVNPDGYEFARSPTGNRLWRKNRRYMTDDRCNMVHGVDLNRNFDADWSNAGASDICTKDTYHGPFVFSEPEAQAIRNKVTEIRGLSAYIQLNAYGQMLHTPYGYSNSVTPPNSAQQLAISNKAREAIQASTGAVYTVDRGSTLYAAAGTATDWAYMHANVPFSLSFSVRPELNDSAGFNPEPSTIVDSGEDVWAGLHAVASNL